MAVKIRLKRLGKIRVPQYRIVVVDARKKRDGRVIEEIGKYHPKEDPSYIDVVSDRAQYWLGVGAQPTDAVAALFRVTGDWQKFKGLPGAEGRLRTKAAKRTKLELFNEALQDASGDSRGDAVTRRAAKRTEKAEPSGMAPAAAAPVVAPAPVPADETPEVAGEVAEVEADAAAATPED